MTTSTATPAAGDAPLAEAVQKLFVLNTHLSSAQYREFWTTLDSDDLYADLVADVSGFEELIRVRIAGCVGQAVREIDRHVLEEWLNLQGKEFDRFVSEVCEWAIDGDVIKVPLNKENEAKGTVIRENVKFDRESAAGHIARPSRHNVHPALSFRLYRELPWQGLTCQLRFTIHLSTCEIPNLLSFAVYTKFSEEARLSTGKLMPHLSEFSKMVHRAYERPA